MLSKKEKKIGFEKVCTFTGAPGNPLLAPRGVFLNGNLLVVSDTGQNRVFIWKHFLFNEAQEADLVLGQMNTEGTGRNSDEKVHASSLQYPSGIWTDGEKLIVADAWNHRVLIWNQIPTRHGAPADVVLGQPDFTSNQPNVFGITEPPSASTLYWPYGVWSNKNHLWIADTGNRRVLFYENIPSENFSPADAVIGQQDFSSKDYDTQHSVWPYAVKVNDKGSLAITDTQCFRVLIWEHFKDAIQQKPPILLGQPNLSSIGQNQYRLAPAHNTLNWCYDVCFLPNGVATADTGNSRIMIWNTLPEESNAPADDQIGQADFTTNGEASLSLNSSKVNEMYWPFAIQQCGDYLVIADTGNHRILLYKNIKT